LSQHGRTADGENPREEGRSQWRILLVIKCLDYGGAERLLVDMAALRDRTSFDYEAAYVLEGYDGLSSAMRSTGTPLHSLGAGGDWDLKWLASFRRLLAGRHYDLVHFHLPYAASLGRLVVRSLPRHSRPKVVYTQHCTWGEMELPVRMLSRATIRFDDALVAVSESSRQSLPKSLRPRAQVVIHGVDVSRPDLLQTKEIVRREVRAELGISDEQLLVLTVANLRPEKGYEVLLEAARILLGRRAPVAFASVGHGPLADELHRIHGELGLGDRFRFLGLRHDVLRLMTGADVFVLSSHHEGMPVAVMEATSVGLPLVLTSVGEFPRMFTDGVDALVVSPGHPQALADVVERLVQDSALREKLGRAALDRSATFDVRSAVYEIESLYRRLLAE
jgi:glycosyltransferase involved in cell wall biosynthesis